MRRATAPLFWLATACGTITPDGPAGDDSGLPDNAFCDAVSEWDGAWEAWEEAIVEDVRAARATGATCGELGTMAGVETDVFLSGALTCAARAHAADMAARDFFAHDDPDGVGPDDRVLAAGGGFLGIHEDIQAGALDPDQVTPVWLANDQQCADLLLPEFNRIGVGYYGGEDGAYDGYVVLLLGVTTADR